MGSHQVVAGGQTGGMDDHGQQVVIGGQMGGQMEIHGQEMVEHQMVVHQVTENGEILDANGQIIGMVEDANMAMGVMDGSMMGHSRKRRHDEFMPRHAAPLYCGITYGPRWLEAPSSGVCCGSWVGCFWGGLWVGVVLVYYNYLNVLGVEWCVMTLAFLRLGTL